MLTAYGDVELAVKALKNGAADFLLKPWDNQALIDKVTEAYRNNMKPSERQTKETKKEGFEAGWTFACHAATDESSI